MPLIPYLINTLSATVWDNNGIDEHPLTSEVILKPGRILAKTIKTDLNVPLSATFISEDESGQFIAAATLVDTTGGMFTWNFEWADVPELGCRAILRFEEVTLMGTGAISNFVVHITGDNDDEPGLEPIGIGTPVLIGP
jgi:hypothetical protein